MALVIVLLNIWDVQGLKRQNKTKTLPLLSYHQDRHSLTPTLALKYFFKNASTQLFGFSFSSNFCKSFKSNFESRITPCIYCGKNHRRSHFDRANDTAVLASQICAKCWKSQSFKWRICANCRTAFKRSCLSPVWAMLRRRQATECLKVFHHFPMGWMMMLIQY